MATKTDSLTEYFDKYNVLDTYHGSLEYDDRDILDDLLTDQGNHHPAANQIFKDVDTGNFWVMEADGNWFNADAEAKGYAPVAEEHNDWRTIVNLFGPVYYVCDR